MLEISVAEAAWGLTSLVFSYNSDGINYKSSKGSHSIESFPGPGGPSRPCPESRKGFQPSSGLDYLTIKPSSLLMGLNGRGHKTCYVTQLPDNPVFFETFLGNV